MNRNLELHMLSIDLGLKGIRLLNREIKDLSLL